MLDPKILTFLKVAEVKHFTRAAQALNLTQPAVSQQIHRLEDHYGAKLVMISGKGVRLTAAGEALLRYAHLQLANETQLLAQLDHIEPPLRIGATLSIADYYLPSGLVPYLERTGEPVSVTVQNTQTILELLLTNGLDCAFVEGIFDQTVFHHEEFIRTQFVPVARRDHPLSGQTASLAQIHEYPLILRETGSGTREIYETFLYEQNDTIRSARVIHEIASFRLIKAILADTDGISFMYEGVAGPEIQAGQLEILHLAGFSIQRPLCFIWPRNSLTGPRNEAFFQRFMQAMKDAESAGAVAVPSVSRKA